MSNETRNSSAVILISRGVSTHTLSPQVHTDSLPACLKGPPTPSPRLLLSCLFSGLIFDLICLLPRALRASACFLHIKAVSLLTRAVVRECSPKYESAVHFFFGARQRSPFSPTLFAPSFAQFHAGRDAACIR